MDASGTSSVLEISALDVHYGPVQALFGVTLAVEPGELVVVLGGNASGKSTILRAVLGLVRPSHGSIRYRGEEIGAKPPHRIVALGLGSIPEGRRLFADMTVWENLLMGAYARRNEKNSTFDVDIEHTLSVFPRLKERLKQTAGTLSGGEQQMLAMARAWIRKPDFLCIDEPSMGLSPAYVDLVYEVIAEWKKQKVSILMVEQNANRALQIGDRAYVLRTGEIVLAGPASDLAIDRRVQAAYLGTHAGS